MSSINSIDMAATIFSLKGRRFINTIAGLNMTSLNIKKYPFIVLFASKTLSVKIGTTLTKSQYI